MDGKKGKMSAKSRLLTTVLIALLALSGITAATVAWFSITDRGMVYSMELDITSGPSLRIDVDPHEAFEDYLPTLSFYEIADRVLIDEGYDMKTTPLKPVTTSDCETFTFRSGAVVPRNTGAYWEFTLHFMGSADQIVHLTMNDSKAGNDGTLVYSTKERLPQSMRISFTADGKTVVYDPGMGDAATTAGEIKTFGLERSDDPVYNDNAIVFPLIGNVDKPVLVRVWMEGTDPACTDELRGADFAIRLRFEGTDENGNRMIKG